ncbi:ShlB/FhaC/HecB family hemolysin secretion/activation protein [Haloferula rosea]|uniref:ShlB/FhaC/HecB family hemolysin secretion/activation protein n=1 Tax=Haloferula rosea TaxID=490093 RepID=UPI002D7F0D52|nr:ShlB/FhaC/HecB family hemolysin secretion/activation protein [Haloferula rosea]
MPSPKTLAARLETFLGHSLKQSDLWRIGDILLSHYDIEGYPVVNVEAPEQSFEGGQLVLIVELGRFARVGVTRPIYGCPEVIEAGLHLREGEVLRRSEIDDQLGWYGRSIFRRPRLFVSPGDEPATADVLIGLEESRPWRVTTGYDNSGTDLLGKDRFQLGVAGMTPAEHVISWQTVVGMPVSSLSAHALSWEIPLHRYHQTIRFDAAYARVDDRYLSNGLPLDNQGASWAVSGLHRFQLPSYRGWRHNVLSGFEVKGTDQFVLFGSGRFAPGEVRFVHAKVGYDLHRSWENAGVGLDASVVASPGNLISGNDDIDFKAYDFSADSSYVIARAAGQGWWSPGGDWRIGLRGAIQLADSRLLPSEQFAAGGYQTVRGVSEREYIADQGWHSSLEVFTPAWRPINRCQVRFLGFLDHASLGNRGGASTSLTGTGVGLRLMFGRWVDLRLDHGWRLDEPGGQTHLGLRFTY